MWELTLMTQTPVSFRSWCWVCQPVSACSSWAICHRTFRLLGKELGFFLVLSILRIGFIVVEVNCGLNWETGQHFFPRTLQIFLTL